MFNLPETWIYSAPCAIVQTIICPCNYETVRTRSQHDGSCHDEVRTFSINSKFTCRDGVCRFSAHAVERALHGTVIFGDTIPVLFRRKSEIQNN